jgi:hypothetical protein
MVPRTKAGRRARNALTHLPLLKAASAVERRVQARNARPLPEYAPAGPHSIPCPGSEGNA